MTADGAGQATAPAAGRIAWIDCAKGLGILLVVVGHATDGFMADWIYMFHMPMFFMISGMLFRPIGIGEFIGKRMISLALPYVSFLAVMLLAVIASHVVHGAPANVARTIIDAIYGGQRLSGDFGTFWFVTCLFGALFIYNLIRNVLTDPLNPWFAAGMILLAELAVPLGHIVAPGNMQVIPMAIVFLWAGEVWGYFMGRAASSDARVPNGDAALAVLVALAMAGVGLLIRRPMDMKYGQYGIPLLSVMVAVAMSHLVLLLSRRMSEVPWLARGLSALGGASLCIMFLHRTITVHLAGRLDWPVVSLIATIVPFAVYVLLKRSGAPIRLFFLGEQGPIRALAARWSPGRAPRRRL